MFQFITAISSAVLLGWVSTVLHGKWANVARIALIGAAVANAVIAAKTSPWPII